MTRDMYSHTAVVLGHIWREGLSGHDLASEMHEAGMPLLVSHYSYNYYQLKGY